MTVYTVISTVLWQGVLLFCIIIMVNTHRHVEHIIHREAYKDDKKLLNCYRFWKLNIFKEMAKTSANNNANPTFTAATTPRKSCLKLKYFLIKSSTVTPMSSMSFLSPYCDSSNPYKVQAIGHAQ